MRESVNSRAMEAWLKAQGADMDGIIAGPYLFGVTWHALQVHPERSWLLPCLHDEAFAYQEVIGDLFRKVKGLLFNALPEQELAERLYGVPREKGTVVGMGLESFEVDASACEGCSAPCLGSCPLGIAIPERVDEYLALYPDGRAYIWRELQPEFKNQ